MGFRCVNCGGKATNGDMKHPYCEECWKKIWEGKEEQYREWLPHHNTVLGALWYKENILERNLNLLDRFLLHLL